MEHSVVRFRIAKTVDPKLPLGFLQIRFQFLTERWQVKNHRIGLTLYKIDQIMDGALDELIDALTAAEQAEKLKAEADEG